MSWSSRVIEELAACKAAGMLWEDAWREAVGLHPPRGQVNGPVAMRLFDEDGKRERGESVVEFTRRACEDAWFNRRPALAHFGGLRDVLDDLEESQAARKVSGRAGPVQRLVA